MRTTVTILGLMAVGLLTLLVHPPDASAGNEPEEPTLEAVLPATDDEVTQLLDAVEKAGKKDTELLAAALHDMGRRSHEKFVPVILAGLASKNARVLESAVLAAVANGMHDQEKAIKKAFKRAEKKKPKSQGGGINGSLGAACITYFAKFAIEGHEEKVLEDHFRPLYTNERRMTASWAPGLVKSATMYFGKMKYMKSVPMLVAQIREPYPENPNSENNPPASYWEKRYKIWQETEGYIRWALKEITGNEFRTHREWKAWVSANKKLFK